VIVSDDVKSGKQCSEAVKKANRILGMIKQNFTDRSRETIISLYKTLVRLHLEYCSAIWSPHYDKDIKLIESVSGVRREGFGGFNPPQWTSQKIVAQ